MVELLGLVHQAQLRVELQFQIGSPIRIRQAQLPMARAVHIGPAEQQIRLFLQQPLIVTALQQLLLALQFALFLADQLLQLLFQLLAAALELLLALAFPVVVRQRQVERQGLASTWC